MIARGWFTPMLCAGALCWACSRERSHTSAGSSSTTSGSRVDGAVGTVEGASTGGSAVTSGSTAAADGSGAAFGVTGPAAASSTGSVSVSGGATGITSGAAGAVTASGGASSADNVSSTGTSGASAEFQHPGLLLTALDIERMRTMVAAQEEPYLSGYNRMQQESRAALDYQPTPFGVVTRNTGAVGAGNTELRDDANAAFFHAVLWVVSGEQAHAEKSKEILNAWSSTLQAIEGDADRFLAAGLYGYQLANAAELLRHTYAGWDADEIERFEGMLLNIFYPLSREFLDTHAGSRVDHHFANWDASQMVTLISIGVFADDRDKYEEAIDYFMNGEGNGNIARAVFDGETGQLQESGRDQAHAQLGIGLLAAMCQTALNQGDDLFSHDDNRLLKGFEYTAQYLLGYEVPFATYSDASRTHTEISPLQRAQRRPIYEMIYNHYAVRRGIPAPFTEQLAGEIRPEGYHGDHPGFGSLLFTR